MVPLSQELAVVEAVVILLQYLNLQAVLVEAEQEGVILLLLYQVVMEQPILEAVVEADQLPLPMVEELVVLE
jgi:hypothetical protein